MGFFGLKRSIMIDLQDAMYYLDKKKRLTRDRVSLFDYDIF